ncbi:MAG TPA: potassium channel protein [Thiotrichales bacterium]|nr:potassium channel protein [Thiotrichales bacterium]
MKNVVFILLRRLHLPLIVLILVYAVSILGFVVIPGQDDQGNPWRMDFFHAFYFVSFMGSTIGFGEIPYPFTGAQRMWASVTIYATVIAWLYGIGSLLSIIQDPAFRQLITENTFRRAVRRMRDPFYLVGGYGDTGSQLVRSLVDAGFRVVVVDIDPERINLLDLEDLGVFVPGLCADAANPEVLEMAGLKLPNCIGVVALTNHDHVNLMVAITTKLHDPRLPVIARAETSSAEANIASFGTEYIINPFEVFAEQLTLALHAPGALLLQEWLAAAPHERLEEPLFPPHGKWILCGYGRFGQAIHRRFQAVDESLVVVEVKPEKMRVPPGSIAGRGTEAHTLLEAGVEEAVGIIAGTNDDADNLSIILTARELNPDLFTVVRQNQRLNDAVFRAIHADLVMRRGDIIAHRIFSLIIAPLLEEFLEEAKRQGNAWANQLVARLSGLLGEEAPAIWEVELDRERAPAVVAGIAEHGQLALEILLRDPRDREASLSCIPLYLWRGGRRELLPDGKMPLHPHDRILFCGQPQALSQMEWILQNRRVLHYIVTGEELPGGWVWRKLNRREDSPAL